MDVALWRPLPFEHPERLVEIAQPGPQGDSLTALSPSAYLELRQSVAIFEGVGAVRLTRPLQLDGEGLGEDVTTRLVSTNLFHLLGLAPAAGRFFAAEHEGSGAARLYVVLSYNAWTKWFGRNPSAIGQVLKFSDGPRTIVGVLPRGVSLPMVTGPEAGAYLPYVPDQRDATNTTVRSVFVVARMRDHVAMADAQREVARFGPGVVISLDVRARGGWSRWFALINLSVLLTYLAACLSLAVGLMTDTVRRAHEHMIRRALGATGRRLFGESFARATTLTIAAGLAGLLLAAWAVEFLRTYLIHEVPRASEIQIGVKVAAIAIGVSIISGLLISSATFFLMRRLERTPNGIYSGGGSRGMRVAMRGGLFLQAALVAGLLVGTALIGASYIHFVNVDLGFDEKNVFLVSYSARRPMNSSPAEAATIRAELIRELRREPAIAEVAMLLGSAPLTGGATKYSVRVPGAFVGEQMVDTLMVTAGFFEALRIPLVSGRMFTETDRRGDERVAIINEAAGREWFGAESALGKSLELNGPIRIVGVVKSQLPNGPGAPAPPTVFTLVEQEPFAAGMTFGTVVGRLRTGDRQAVTYAREVVRRVTGADPSPAGFLEDNFRDLAKSRRFSALVTLATAILAVIVATAALYGNTRFFVMSGRREIAIRLALGAPPLRVLWTTVAMASVTVAAGGLCGLAVAALSSQSMEAFLFGVAASDWRVYLGVIALVVMASIAATFGPGREASRVNPREALQS